MKELKKSAFIPLAAALAGGLLLRFLYPLLPNFLTAIFSPINGSVWESMKLLFWPLVAVFLCRWIKYKVGGFPAAILLACLVQYVISFFLHVTLARPGGWLDVVIYALLMAAALFAAPRLAGKEGGKSTAAVTLLTLALAVAIVIFTFLPPDHISFADLAGANTWLTLPV